MDSNLKRKLMFIEELERLKTVYRTNKVIEEERFENSAEHSWHVSIMAILLEENFVSSNLDMLKIIKMLLIHEVVEIDAGDVNVYKKDVLKTQQEEQKAALRIFGLLPSAYNKDFHDHWVEFEERKTMEAKIAAAIDALQPLINHTLTRDKDDQVLDIRVSQIINKKKFIQEISPQLWSVAQHYIKKGVEKGLYIDDTQEEEHIKVITYHS